MTISYLLRFTLLALMLSTMAACSWIDNLNDQEKPNGQSLYNNNCARCHGADATGGTGVGTDTAAYIQGRTPQDLQNAINTVPEMASLINIGFTWEQLQAISDYLMDLLLVSSLLQPTIVPGQVDVAAAAGDIQLRDRDGRWLQTRSDANGDFSIMSFGLRFPLLLQFSADGDGRRHYGRVEAGAPLFVSPLTDVMTRDVLRDDEIQALFQGCIDEAGCAVLFARTGHDNRLIAWRLQQRLALAQISAAETPLADPVWQPLAAQLELQRLPGCGNAWNPQGYIYDQDSDGDCYADTDLDFDGFEDADLNRDGLPDS